MKKPRRIVSAALIALFALALAACGSKQEDEDSDATAMPPSPPPPAGATPAPQRLTGDLTWTLDPGVGVGPLKKDGSEDDLIAAYGAAAVSGTEVKHGDHGTATASLIFAADPMRRVTIEWVDGGGRRIPARATIEGDSSAWALPGGVTLGTPLDELERLNGTAPASSPRGAMGTSRACSSRA